MEVGSVLHFKLYLHICINRNLANNIASYRTLGHLAYFSCVLQLVELGRLILWRVWRAIYLHAFMTDSLRWCIVIQTMLLIVQIVIAILLIVFWITFYSCTQIKSACLDQFFHAMAKIILCHTKLYLTSVQRGSVHRKHSNILIFHFWRSLLIVHSNLVIHHR